MAGFRERMIGAAKLDVATFEEIEADTTAMGQAMGAVLLSAIAGGLGSIGDGGARAFISVTIAALLGWYVWAFLTWLVGTKILATPQTNADLGQLLRTIGFSSSPGLLRVFGIVPFMGGLVTLVSGVWMLIAMTIAVRQALDYTSTGRAVAVCVVGFLFYLGFMSAVALMFGVGAGLVGFPAK
jgi:hypothetical protein